MKHFLIPALFICFSGFIPTVLAQGPGGPGPGGPIPTPPTPMAIPIDGGASLLLAGGVALGLKKLHDHKKKRKAGN